MTRSHNSLFLVTLVAALFLAAAPLNAQPTDVRIQLNPALAAVYARNPATATRILQEVERILESPPPHPPGAPGNGTRGSGEGAYRGLLDHNPLLQEAYRINPKAVLIQLKEIISITGTSG